MKTLLNILILGALAAAGAWGGIVITLDAPSQTGHPDGTLHFFGVISNTGSDTVFLNGDPLTLAGLSFTIIDQFFATVPISLAGNTSSLDIDLFDVTVSNPLLDPPGKYLGSYGLIGGLDGDASDNLASADFDVTTAPGGTTVPEPGSWLLLGTAVAALGAVRRPHRRRA
jgi:hypothetical protein